MTFGRRTSRPQPWLVAVVALAALSSCCKKVPRPQGPTIATPGARVTLDCPAEAPSQGPIPFTITLDADARTYWDNQGILDEALQVVLIRRDRPGMRFVAKTAPGAIMLPNPPLPGRPSEEVLAKDASRTTEVKEYDLLAYGQSHKGTAEYFVVASFADAWAGPRRLSVVDPAGPMVAEIRAPLVLPAQQAVQSPTAHGLQAGVSEGRGHPSVFGAFRVSAAADPSSAPFVSIVMARLRSSGGISYGQFRLSHARDRDDLVGSFGVPISLLTPAPVQGRYVLFAFVGDESSGAKVVEIR